MEDASLGSWVYVALAGVEVRLRLGSAKHVISKGCQLIIHRPSDRCGDALLSRSYQLMGGGKPSFCSA